MTQKSHWQRYKDHLANPPSWTLPSTIYHLRYDAERRVISCEAHRFRGDLDALERKAQHVYGGGEVAEGLPVWSLEPVEIYDPPPPAKKTERKG